MSKILDKNRSDCLFDVEVLFVVGSLQLVADFNHPRSFLGFERVRGCVGGGWGDVSDPNLYGRDDSCHRSHYLNHITIN